MEPGSVQGLYDEEYASAYDERFLTGEDWSRQGSDFELEVIGGLLDRPDARWLDVGCGTGYYLGRFPEVERAGLDLSPGMLRSAAENAPGVPLVEGSYLDAHPEWKDRWSLVSCMWAAYSYVGSVAQVEELVANLASWTAPEGSAFLPVCDVADLAGGIDVPYRNADTWVFGGELLIKAVIWDWEDEKLGKHHLNLVAPHLEHLVEVFGRHYRKVEVVRYPPYLPGWDTRKAIVASEKRVDGDATAATVVRHLPPPCRTVLPDPEVAPGDEVAPAEEAAPADEVAPAEAPPVPVAAEPTATDGPAAPASVSARARWNSVGQRGKRKLVAGLRALAQRLDD